MSANAVAVDQSRASNGRALTVALWIAQIAVAAILGMAAFGKFFMYTPDGSMALAQALGVGRGVVTVIGLVELVAAVMILIPRKHIYGALLAAGAMLGALFSHATKLGWSGNAAAEMWPLALAVLAAAAFVLVVRRARS